MQNESREQAIERIKPLLTEREWYAYLSWQKSNLPALAPSLNAKLFNLFLNGKSCEEIRRLNQSIALGQIVSARIEGDWDRRRNEHLDRLLDETSRRVQQVTMETAEFVCDLLAVANREHGDALRRYLQSGNPDELGGFHIESIGGLKQAIEVLQKLTGQDKQSKLTVAGEILHREVEGGASKQQPTPEQANNVLKLLIGSKQ